MIALFDSMDLFGVQPRINVKGHSQSPSRFGVILTIILTTIFITSVAYFSQDMIKKTNPTILQQSLVGVNKNKLLPYYTERLVIGMYNLVYNLYVFDPTIFNIVARFHAANNSIIQMYTKPCLPTNVSLEYNIIAPSTMICLDPPPGVTIPDINYVEFFIMECVNGTSPFTCKTQLEIEQFFLTSVMLSYYTDYSIDLKNYNEPIRHIFNDVTFAFLDNDKVVRLDVAIKELLITTDNGWLFEEKSSVSLVSFDTLYYTIVNPILFNSTSLRMYIKFWNQGKRDNFERSYLKIQDLNAQVISVVNIFAIFFALFAQNYANFKMYVKISNDVIDYRVKNKQMPKLHNTSSPSIKEPEKRQISSQNSESFFQTQLELNDEVVIKDVMNTNDNSFEGIYTKPTRIKKDTQETGPKEIVLGNNINRKQKNFPRNNQSLHLIPEDLSKEHAKVSISHEESDAEPKDRIENLLYKVPKTTKSFKNLLNYEKSPTKATVSDSQVEIDTKFKEESVLDQSQAILGSTAAPLPVVGLNLLPLAGGITDIIERDRLDVTFWDWMLAPVRKSETNARAKKAREYIDQQLDVVKICIRLLELERLKEILLDDQQRVLFEQLKKPKLSLKDMNKLNQIEQDESGNLGLNEKKISVEEAYSAIKNKTKKKNLDINLLKLYEEYS